jgi:hypothetical protein
MDPITSSSGNNIKKYTITTLYAPHPTHTHSTSVLLFQLLSKRDINLLPTNNMYAHVTKYL